MFAQIAPKFAVHADIDFGIGQFLDVGNVTTQRENYRDLSTNAFDQTTDFSEI